MCVMSISERQCPSVCLLTVWLMIYVKIVYPFIYFDTGV